MKGHLYFFGMLLQAVLKCELNTPNGQCHIARVLSSFSPHHFSNYFQEHITKEGKWNPHKASK